MDAVGSKFSERRIGKKEVIFSVLLEEITTFDE
jgi:hypothetical protein